MLTHLWNRVSEWLNKLLAFRKPQTIQRPTSRAEPVGVFRQPPGVVTWPKFDSPQSREFEAAKLPAPTFDQPLEDTLVDTTAEVPFTEPAVGSALPAERSGERESKPKKQRRRRKIPEGIRELETPANGAHPLHAANDKFAFSATLSELLENLDAAFATLKLPTMPTQWLTRQEINGLKKLGVHVPNPWVVEWSKNRDSIKVDVSKPMPAMMAISTGQGSVNLQHKTSDDRISPSVMFAIKLNKLPWYSQQNSGVPYLFGYAYNLDKKLYWMHMYLTVNPTTGELRACDELTYKVNKIPLRNPAARRQARGGSIRIPQKAWLPGRMLSPVEDKSTSDLELNAMNCFRAVYTWWSTRDERWSVAVKKDNTRITFGVPASDTKRYFADREKIVNERGNSRRILHCVREYTRSNGTVVKAQLRGLREFDWNGYHCLITAPNITGITAAGFDLAAVDMAKIPRGNRINAEEVAEKLVELEDRDMRPPKRTRTRQLKETPH